MANRSELGQPAPQEPSFTSPVSRFVDRGARAAVLAGALTSAGAVMHTPEASAASKTQDTSHHLMLTSAEMQALPAFQDVFAGIPDGTITVQEGEEGEGEPGPDAIAAPALSIGSEVVYDGLISRNTFEGFPPSFLAEGSYYHGFASPEDKSKYLISVKDKGGVLRAFREGDYGDFDYQVKVTVQTNDGAKPPLQKTAIGINARAEGPDQLLRGVILPSEGKAFLERDYVENGQKKRILLGKGIIDIPKSENGDYTLRMIGKGDLVGFVANGVVVWIIDVNNTPNISRVPGAPLVPNHGQLGVDMVAADNSQATFHSVMISTLPGELGNLPPLMQK